jgi:predicted RND superfamily exporter protein
MLGDHCFIFVFSGYEEKRQANCVRFAIYEQFNTQMKGVLLSLVSPYLGFVFSASSRFPTGLHIVLLMHGAG